MSGGAARQSQDINNAGQIVGTFRDSAEVTVSSTSAAPSAPLMCPARRRSTAQVASTTPGRSLESSPTAQDSTVSSTSAAPSAPLMCPARFHTCANGINNAGQIVGNFADRRNRNTVSSTSAAPSAPLMCPARSPPRNWHQRRRAHRWPLSRVPEPGSLVLFSVGLLGLGLAWQRRLRYTPQDQSNEAC